jgi:hypothetical protein
VPESLDVNGVFAEQLVLEALDGRLTDQPVPPSPIPVTFASVSILTMPSPEWV